MSRQFSGKAFETWLRTNGINHKRAADLLGCSPMSIYNWKRNGAPHYIGLACAALEAGLQPPPEAEAAALPAPPAMDAADWVLTDLCRVASKVG